MNLTGAREFRQLSECSGKNRLVALPVIGRTENAADWMIDEGGARRGDLAHDVMGRADDQCRNSAGFDHMSDETDGLVAERSVGDLQAQIDFSFLKSPPNSRSKLVFYHCVSSNAAHNRHVMRR